MDSIDGSDDNNSLNNSLLNNGIPIQNIQNTIPLVQVSMNEYPDDDDLPTTVIINRRN